MDKFVTRKRRKQCTGGEEEGKSSSPGSESKCMKIKTETTPPYSKSSPDPKLLYSGPKPEIQWKKIFAESLDLDYCMFLSREEGDILFEQCEKELQYNTGQLAKIQIFGKWIDIPRKQVAFGDSGLTYTFSGNCVPARPWTPLLNSIRDRITESTGQRFNFVLINRYQNGLDYMGEHRDDEKDLVKESPIASLSLGQPRDFIFRHAASRGKGGRKDIAPVKMELEHGSLLMMNFPTNVHWYHALPKRKGALGVRINMTFRDFVIKKK